MDTTSPSRRTAVMLVVLLALQLFLMSDGARRRGGSASIESLVMRVSSPAVIAAQVGAGGLERGLSGARDLLSAHSRNRALEAELQQLQVDLVSLREADAENRRLRRLLDMRESLVPRSIAASIVTANFNGRTRVITIDRGHRDGVRPDQPAVAWGGAVGRVIAVATRHAKIRLLTDTSSGVAGVVQRSRAQGIVEGAADGALHLLYVPQYAEVVHGDRVVTSGLDGIFPRGFGIGTVVALVERPGGGQTIHLQPELDYDGLEEVLVLLEPPAAPAGEEPVGEATAEEEG
jgi:rod shape-determining protein MreC